VGRRASPANYVKKAAGNLGVSCGNNEQDFYSGHASKHSALATISGTCFECQDFSQAAAIGVRHARSDRHRFYRRSLLTSNSLSVSAKPNCR
jgi:hypothetical protein